MGNQYTEEDIGQILNNPGIFYFRKYGSTGDYIKAVFTNGAEFNINPEGVEVGFDDTGTVFDAIGKETGEVKFDFGKPFDLSFMSELSGGLLTKTTDSGGAKVVVDQDISAGWTDKKPIQVNLVDADGKAYVADGEPAITSVEGDTTGALAPNVDYTIVPNQNSYSGYSIILNTAGTAGVGEDEVITITFNSPTVVGKTILSGGGVKNYDAIEGYYETILKGDQIAKCIFYRGFYDGKINITYGTEESPEAAVTNVMISLKNDGTRDKGDQMFRLERDD